MKREEILKKCFEKVIKNGWNKTSYSQSLFANINCRIVRVDKYGDFEYKYYNTVRSLHINSILFDHSFCKAIAKYIYESNQHEYLLGISNPESYGDLMLLNKIEREFKIGLVLSEDRLKYMEKFLKE